MQKTQAYIHYTHKETWTHASMHLNARIFILSRRTMLYATCFTTTHDLAWTKHAVQNDQKV